MTVAYPCGMLFLVKGKEVIFMLDKNKLDEYIESHLVATGKDDYKLAFVSSEKGLYSGIVSYDDKGKKKYMDFILDFVNRSLQIGGISGKQLKQNAGTLNKVFNYGNYTAVDNLSELSLQTLDTIKAMGWLYGSLGKEPATLPNMGRGVLRALNYFPLSEQYVKEFHKVINSDMDASRNADKENHEYSARTHWLLIIYLTYAQSKEKKHKSFQKLLGITKSVYEQLRDKDLLKNINNIYYGNYMYLSEYCDGKISFDSLEGNLSFGTIDYLKRLGKYDWNKLEQVIQDVDNQRGYHDASIYYEQFRSQLNRELQYYDSYRSIPELVGLAHTDVYTLAHYLYASCYHQQALSLSEAR